MASGDVAKPKHLRLFEELGRAIQKGTFAPGQRLPTEAELMHQYGVSRTTVTRTLRDLEHQGVIWRRRGSGTFVKEKERTATEQFGMIVHGIEPGSIFLGVYEALARATDRTGAHLRLTHLTAQTHHADEAAETAERMIGLGVRGVFYLPHSISRHGDEVNRRVTDLFTQARVPVVLLDRDICQFPSRSSFDLVSVDNLRGGYLLGEHMIEAGCRRPVFFSADVPFSSARARWMGYRMAMEAHGLEARSLKYLPDSPAELMEEVRRQRPDGIVCDNDRHAAIVMRHLLGAKVEIPGEIRLSGFDDTPTAALLAVPLTTVRQPAGAIALRAMGLMKERLAHPQMPPAQVEVQCELVVRESTAGAADAAARTDSAAPAESAEPAVALSGTRRGAKA